MATDYYPFGMAIPERQWYTGSDSSNYRFGFNGMEKDNEAKGFGNSLDFGARIYDSRLGRWLGLDPIMDKYPSISPFCFGLGNPISFIDFDGREVIIGTTFKGTKYEAVYNILISSSEVYKNFLKSYSESTILHYRLENQNQKNRSRDVAASTYYVDYKNPLKENEPISGTYQTDFFPSAESFTGGGKYENFNFELNDLGRAVFLLHEAKHASFKPGLKSYEAWDRKSDYEHNNHAKEIATSIYEGLVEYNKAQVVSTLMNS